MFVEVTKEELESVSTLTRGRSKLKDVNNVYRIVFDFFQSRSGRRKKIVTRADLAKKCKIIGQVRLYFLLSLTFDSFLNLFLGCKDGRKLAFDSSRSRCHQARQEGDHPQVGLFVLA